MDTTCCKTQGIWTWRKIHGERKCHRGCRNSKMLVVNTSKISGTATDDVTLFLSHSLGVSVCTNSSFWDKFKWNCWKHAWVMRASVCTGKNLKQQSNSRARKRQTIQTCWNLVLLSYWLFEMHSTFRFYFVIFLIIIPISLSWFSPGGLNEPQSTTGPNCR